MVLEWKTNPALSFTKTTGRRVLVEWETNAAARVFHPLRSRWRPAQNF